MILDAIVAAIIFKVFGQQGLWVLAITCCVNFLRMSGRLKVIFDTIDDVQMEIKEEEEK